MGALPEIDAHTGLYAVFGDPVGHSLSPTMHNRAFQASGQNGVYVALRVRDIETAVAAVRSLSIRGVSITVPHKTAVIPFLDHVDATARAIGAVNTIVNDDGRLHGYNTDAPAAVRALKDMVVLAGRKAAILGAGGAARAVGFGLAAENVPIVVVNRTRSRGKELAERLGAGFEAIEDFQPTDDTILINTTPVGMWPQVDAVPIAPDRLRPGMMVMDIIYNPLQSLLLREAAAKGCPTLNGIPMFVYQGAMQFKLWTDQEAPLSVMMQSVTDALAAAATGNGQRSPSERCPE
jgi:shikimate dehydrogenase